MSKQYVAYKTAADFNECLDTAKAKYRIDIVETGKSVQYQILYCNSSQYKSSELIDILDNLKLLMGTVQFAEVFDETRVTATKRAS